ncbi:MAG TPA: general stress protein CsbD [Prolixibacteraceae bacterium]|nr:general stress protein CsbD [Prolixibacteraceae bacterium]
METNVFKAKLIEEKAKLKQKLASLTDDDLLLEEGRKEELDGKYQAMFFQSEEEVDTIFSSW